jgi:hypothetical protein
MENLGGYYEDLKSRTTNYISAIDDVIKDKITLGQT